MKTKITLMLIAAAASACAQNPSTGDQGRIGIFLGPLGGSTTITLTGMNYHCESKQGGGGNGPTGKFDDCKGIPVIVLEDSAGECWSFLPYNQLLVHRKDKDGDPRDVEIEWQLQQTDRFKFDTGNRGIDLKPTKQTMAGPVVNPEANHYSRQSPSEKKITWTLKGNAQIDFKFDHDAQVVRSADGHLCKKVDPLITNAD